MNDEQLHKAWVELKAIHAKYLNKHKVNLPTEKSAKRIWLSILYATYKQDPEKYVSKNEISQIVTRIRPDLGGDQQVRHLKRDGWKLITGKPGFHKIDPYSPSSTFTQDTRRRTNLLRANNFGEIKEAYTNSCASCGTKEGEKSWRYGEVVRLEQGHRDPEQPQEIDNIIPQCQFCNKTYKSDFTFDENGFIRAIASINPVKRASQGVQESVWKLLRDKFEEKN